ncbi:MAG: OsmC family protein [Candidatus Delongbacteria bacterium]|nr:OsmC family protein [Candidatus Delongbacteria bacterium]
MTEKTKTHAIVQRVDGLTFAARSNSNHWVMMDTSREFGGAGAGSTPMELILMALGGCTGMDVLSILQKKRLKVTDLRLELEGEKSTDYPMVYTHITITYHVYGHGIKEEDVKRAVELSESKYCSVQAMLRQSCPITLNYQIYD